MKNQEIRSKINNLIKTNLSVDIIKTNSFKINKLSKISKIVVIGSSGTGKTTLVNSIRNYCADADSLDIPKRICTRSKRSSDKKENIFVSIERFNELKKTDQIISTWKRVFNEEHKEFYGFSSSDSGVLPIYSANNGLLKDKNSNLIDNETLIIGIYCNEAIRKSRLLKRDPNHFLCRGPELESRLAEPVNSVLNDAHIVFDTSIEDCESNAKEFKKLITNLEKLFIQSNQIRSTGLIKEKAKGRIFRLFTEEHQLPNGKKMDFEFAERSPGVRIIAIDGKKILITKEYRIETSNWDYRLPGGKVWDSLSDYISEPRPISEKAIKMAAKKELLEETGIRLKLSLLDILHTSKCGATVKWDLYYVLATIDNHVPTHNILTSEGENVISQWFTYEEAIKLCLQGGMSEDRSVGVLLKYLLNNSILAA